jgi:hypothetical protein
VRHDLDILGFTAALEIEAPRFASLAEMLPTAARLPGSTATAAPNLVARLTETAMTPPADAHLRLGRRLLAGDEVAFADDLADMPGLGLLLRRSGDRLDLRAAYKPNRLIEIARARYRRLPLASLHQNLLYFLLFFPAMALAEERGWVPVHAAGVRRGERSIVLAGLGGSGKTTLALALLDGDDTALLADNIVVVGEQGVRGVPELVRRDARSKSLLSETVEGKLSASPHLAEHGRRFVDAPGLGSGAPGPDVVLHVALGERTEVRPQSAAECVARQLSMDRLALEMNAYQQFRAVLALTGLAAPGFAEERLQAAFARAACYRVTVAAGRPLGDAVATVLDAIG